LADPTYSIPENPVYHPEIRALQDSDEACASTVFNPLIQRLVSNIHAVKKIADGKASLKQIALTIPITGWVASTNAAFAKQLDLPLADCTQDTIASLTVLPQSMEAAQNCGLANILETLDGKLRLYAARVPGKTIQASLILEGISFYVNTSAPSGSNAVSYAVSDGENAPDGTIILKNLEGK